MSNIGEILICIGAVGIFWNLLLFTSALSMMDIFPDEKKEACTTAARVLICVAGIIVGNVISG